MSLYLASFLIFSILLTAMAVGVMLGRRPIQGSCGGLKAMDGLDGGCEICGWDGNPDSRPGEACPDADNARQPAGQNQQG